MTNELDRQRLSRRALIGGTAAGAAALSLAHFQARANPAGAPHTLRASAQNAGGTLVYGLGFDLDGTLDPQVTNYDSTIRITLNICEPLVWMPTATEFVPGLAESWEVSEDGTEYTFHLKQGVTFHDGTPFTAADVKASLERMKTPPGTLVSPREAALQVIDKIETPDNTTLLLSLKRPAPSMLPILAQGWMSIYSAQDIANDFDFKLKTNGTGPFILREYTLNESQMLEANENYFRGRPKLDRLQVRVVADSETLRLLFETDEIDVFDLDYAPTQTPYFYGNDKWKDLVRSGPRVGVYYYNINQAKKPFDDVRVRKAFQMAIDRQTILDKNFYGKGKLEDGVLPRGVACYAPAAPIAYDPAKAKASAAGQPSYAANS